MTEVSDRFDLLSPRDLAITLHSLARRFTAVSDGAHDPRISDKVDAPDASGDSLTSLVADAAKAAGFLANELERALDHEEAIVPAAAHDPDQREFLDSLGMTIAGAVASIAGDAERAGHRVDHAAPNDLSRSLRVAGGGTTTPDAIAKEMARSCVTLLIAAERRLEQLRD